jgi:hypothetical protein
VLGALADDEHVVGRRAHVFCRAVQPVQGLDGVAEVEEGRAAALRVERRAGRKRDDGLAPAGVEAGGGVLQRHRRREAKGVAEGVAPVRVGPEARPTEGGAENRGVQRDGDEQAAASAGDHLHALVREVGQGQSVRHRGSSFGGPRGQCAMDAAALRHPFIFHTATAKCSTDFAASTQSAR